MCTLPPMSADHIDYVFYVAMWWKISCMISVDSSVVLRDFILAMNIPPCGWLLCVGEGGEGDVYIII